MGESIRIPRALERYPLGEAIEGAPSRWNARDRERGRDVVVTRVFFGAEKKVERDALVARARALFAVSSPALIAVFDAGPWDDDAFLVEDRVIEPQPIGAMELDARERSLAARAVAEGVATLNAAGFSLDALDVVMDAYRQPHIAMGSAAIEATEATRASDLRALEDVVERLAPPAPRVQSAAEMATAIVIADAPPSKPLVHGEAPPRTPLAALAVLGLIALAIAVWLLSR